MRTVKLASLGLLTLHILCAAPAGAAILEGQVVHAQEEDRDLSGLAVHLVAVSSEGAVKTEETQTGPEGTFRFQGSFEKGQYGVYVEYRDVIFPIELVNVDEAAPDEAVPVRLEVYEPSDDVSRIVVLGMSTIIDQGEAGSYRVQHSLLLANPQKDVVLSPRGSSPVAQVGLLPGHEEVAAGLSMRIEPAPIEVDGNRALFHGPVFPGFQSLDLVYEVDAGGPDLDTELFFPEAVATFRLMVPDRQQAVYANGLYPSARDARPQAQEPPGFQYFRGFDLAPGTRLPLRIEQLPDPPASSVAGAVGLALMIGGLCMLVGLPIASDRSAEDEFPSKAREDPDEVASTALAASLADLEHDFEVGKVSAEDRDRLREEMRREAALELVIRRESGPEASPATGAEAPSRTSTDRASTPAAAFCSQCGQPIRANDRFCSSCGHAL